MTRKETARLAAIALTVLALLLVAVACTGSAGSSAAPVETDHVEMPPSYRFDPSATQVPAGTTVTWHNGDNFTHSVLVTGVSDQANVVKPGASVSIRFDSAGTFSYKCTFHPNMAGQIIVVAP